MIITSKPLSPFFFKCGAFLFGLLFNRRFNKMVIDAVDIKPAHSYLLMCNHFSFWDGFWAFYLCDKVFWKKDSMRKMYIMSLKKQMEKNPWLRYCGSFSVEPGKRSIKESFAYAAEVLSTPGNLLVFFPQGKLESSHIRYIKFEEGIAEIVPQIKGNCQLMWSSNLAEYFESLKPSLYFNMLDCGTNHNFDLESLKLKVNRHHLASIKKLIRYTDETDFPGQDLTTF